MISKVYEIIKCQALNFGTQLFGKTLQSKNRAGRQTAGENFRAPVSMLSGTGTFTSL